jgi:hypothetical protein
MNPPPLLQTLGNVCVALAALLYLLPLQWLLLELSRKRDDGGGAIAGLLIVVPMWLLLLAAVLCVVAGGGFDWLRLNRGGLHALAVLGTLSLAAVSLARFEMFQNPDLTTRLLRAGPIHIGVVLSIGLVLLSLNPGLMPGLSRRAVQLPWVVCAGLALLLCGGLVGKSLVRAGGGRLAGIVHRIRNAGPASAELVARVATLDPRRDVDDLLRLAGPYQSRAVREAATARLRSDPGFIDTLAAGLDSGDPSRALEFVFGADLTREEAARLALSTLHAIERFTDDIPAPNYLPPERRKQLLAWGRKTLPVIAEKFAGTGVEFGPVLGAFEQALVPNQRHAN